MKKKLLSLALVVIMIAILSFSSLAWFTDADSAENDFVIGGAGTGKPEDIFNIEVKENVDGEDKPVDNMDFDMILPGDNFKKEAFITNDGAYEQYIRVTMTITDWKLIQNVVTINMDDDFAANWQINAGGVSVNSKGELTTQTDYSVNADGELVVVMYLKKRLAVDETIQIMDFVSVSTKATQEDFAAEGFADGFQIKIKAEAAQTENILKEYKADEWMNAKETFKILDAEKA